MTRAARPADYSPQPAMARGTVLLRSEYAGGPAMTVYNQAAAGFSPLFLSTTGLLDLASLDLHLGGNFGRATTVFDQFGVTNFNGQTTLGEAPKISTLALNAYRWLIFEGGGRSDAVAGNPEVNSVNNAGSIAAAGITAKDYCYMAVVQATGAAHCNQAGAPGIDRGALVNLNNSGAHVLQIINEGVGDGITGGRWTVGDGGAFKFTPTDINVETTPIVLTVISSSRGIELYQNEEIFASVSRSALVSTANESHLGKLSTSAAGPTSTCFDGRVAAEMWWPGLSARDAATRRAMLYELFGIDFRRSRPKSKMLAFCGASNMANYRVVGRNGWEKQMQASMADVRFNNFAVEGSTVIKNSGAVVNYGHMLGLYDHCIGRSIARAQGDVGFVISYGGNDFGLPQLPTASDVYNAILSLIAKARASNPNVKIFLCTSEVWLTAPQTQMATVNTSIRNGAVANNYTVIDFAANPTLTLIFDRHLTESEHGLAASIAAPIIKSKMGWT